MPDLILIPHVTLSVVRRLRGRTIVKWYSYRRMEGTHRPDGIFIAAGPGIGQLTGLRAHIVDCAPTILATLGLPIPDDMEGRVITEIFKTPPVIKTEAARAVQPTAKSATESQVAEAYSQEELQQVTDRLSDLGYLE
jgi:arylsulfatase A-like enzyme